MKKKIVGAILVMAIWAAGAYTLGRYHGDQHGPVSLPGVSVQWTGDEQQAQPTEEVDFVATSYEGDATY